jgi:hypothetical protein
MEGASPTATHAEWCAAARMEGMTTTHASKTGGPTERKAPIERWRGIDRTRLRTTELCPGKIASEPVAKPRWRPRCGQGLRHEVGEEAEIKS